MTARTIAADTGATVRRRPVPWPKLAWVTQRQRRGANIGDPSAFLRGIIALGLPRLSAS